MTRSAMADARWQAAMMNNYGTPPLALVRGQRRRGVGRRRPPLPRPGRRHRRQRARPRAPGRRRGGHQRRSPRWATRPTSTSPSRRSRWPSGCWSCSAAPGRVLFCNSGAEANEAAFKMARRTGRPNIIAAEDAFHGRTMGALALTGQPSQADAVRAAARPGCRTCPTATSPRWTPPSTPTRPRSSSSRSWARRARSPRRRATCAAARRDHRRARRAARARRGADRHRAHRGLVRPPERRRRAGRRHAGQGPRRRAADRGVHRPRAPRPSCSSPASTAPRSAATRSAAPRRWRCSTRSPPTACWSTSRWSARSIATAVEGLGHPLVARRRRRRPADRHRCCPSRCRPPSSPRRGPPGSWSTTRCPTGCGSPRRWCSPRSRPRSSSPRCPGSWTPHDGLGTSCATTTSPRPSRPRCWSWPTR